MIKAEDLQKILLEQMPEAEITIQDLTGGMDHYQVIVLWKGFAGKSLIEQHQIVNKALALPLEDGRLHALQLKTLAPK